MVDAFKFLSLRCPIKKIVQLKKSVGPTVKVPFCRRYVFDACVLFVWFHFYFSKKVKEKERERESGERESEGWVRKMVYT